MRIDLAYRAIVLHPDQGDIYLLAWVDHHDEAMTWAENKVFDVNPVTGALQVLDAVVVEQAVTVDAPSSKPLEAFGPFETFADADLLRTGLPRPVASTVKSLPRLRRSMTSSRICRRKHLRRSIGSPTWVIRSIRRWPMWTCHSRQMV